MPSQPANQLMISVNSLPHQALLTNRQSSLSRLSVRHGLAYDSYDE